MPKFLVSIEDYRELVNSYDTFLFDCDGVVWLGSTLIPRMKETIEYLRHLHKRVIFVSNNSSVSRKDYSKKFAKLGLEVSEEEVFCTAFATAVYLKSSLKVPPGSKVFVIGAQGLVDEIQIAGIEVSENVITKDFTMV
ncbi:hypothetical protein BB560_001507 [Smittium megazygosporum]|uniref:4-nitrophenylphosphatase n=1 Tax=Smittium megazygosporum TaxID=133381 RepID=A0A2T9ZHF3_9FUNG|nr:hypothetical protein BB560_001507 [Smittium megazygosporum]